VPTDPQYYRPPFRYVRLVIWPVLIALALFLALVLFAVLVMIYCGEPWFIFDGGAFVPQHAPGTFCYFMY
jgi:hypothetical protein